MIMDTTETNNWNIQYLKNEDLWYLTRHGEDGIDFEGWYYTASQLLIDLNKYINK
jgi:hypothetical protein